MSGKLSSTSVRPRTHPAIALVAAETSSVTALCRSVNGTRFASAEQLIASGFPADGIVLSGAEVAETQQWLRSLRCHSRLGLSLILLSSPSGAEGEALSNGLAGSQESILERAAAVRQRWDSLERPEPLDGDDQLLTFLYLHPDYRLEPIADWRDERVYRYPLADLYSREREDGFTLLTRLRQRGLLEPVKLVERLHTCPDCTSAHILFNERCPQCASIDITEQNFLHCYACGNVSSQESYLSRGALVCPKCSVQLRHIGVDYDRALETLTCNECSARFTEPDVKARCARCQSQCATDALVARRFDSLRLSSAGVHAARSGSTGDLFALIDDMSQAHPAYFTQTLDWLLALSRRHRDVHFAVLALRFSNLKALAAQVPRRRVAQMLDGLAYRLRELVRSTDLFMRDDDELCWLLLPQTPAPGLAVLQRRIEALGPASAGSDGSSIELAIATITSAELSDTAPNASMLMARLRSALA
jgi:GGDEF domain-containing protein